MKMDDIFSVKNKIIVITGAGRGIGYFLANELSKRSAIVYAIDKTFSKKNDWFVTVSRAIFIFFYAISILLLNRTKKKKKFKVF